MDAAPYDNVEFPVRKPGTGTWPGPGQQQSQMKLMSQTNKDRSGGVKLAPLMESLELADSEDQRNQVKSVSASTRMSSSSVTSSNTSSQPTSPNTPQLLNTTYTTQKVSNQQPIKFKSDSMVRNPVSNEEEDFFDRKDFNAGSRAILDKAYTNHRHYYRLNSKVIEEGSLLKQDVLDVYKKQGEVFSYEQLLQGMLVDGEKLLLGASWLYVTGVEFLDADGTNVLKEPVGKGRICLTNQRVLILSSEIYTDASLSEIGNTSAEYKLDVRKTNSIYYQNLPLTCFHSADLNVAVGTSASSKITMKKPMCRGLCSCFGIAPCVTSWKSTPPMTTVFNKRVVRVGVSMPPWATRMVLLFHLDPEMSLTTARDFISQLQYHAPLMH